MMDGIARRLLFAPMERTEILPSLRLVLRCALAVLGAAALVAGGQPARAQGKLDAEYLVTLGGIPVGKGHWNIEIADDRFTATATGATAGLLRWFASGNGTSSVRGKLVGGIPVLSDFDAKITSNKKTQEFRLLVEGGDAKNVLITPPSPPNPENVPLTDAHRHGVTDPMTASLVRVPGGSNIIGPGACGRTISVFDGRIRFDLQLTYKRVDQISAAKGYSGPAVVCALTFVPIAGHNPHRTAFKYLIKLREMELSLAPIAGTRVLVPFRFTVPTPIGVGIMQATEFVATAEPAQTAAATAKNP